MIMRMAPKPSTDQGKHVHQELGDLLEATVVQQAQSSVERRHPEASLVHISPAHGAHTPSVLWPSDGYTAHRREPSLACSHYIRDHNVHLTQGTRCPGLDWVGKDQLHYGDSDPDNHG